jgi:hypothetical protein
VGKTSLLRQLELLAGGGPRLPVFWDLQGVADAAELAPSFGDALADAEEALARNGIAPSEIADADLVATVRRLLHALAQQRLSLLLLCDEADVLVRLAEGSSLVAELGEELLSSPAAVAILTCSPRSAPGTAAARPGGALLAALAQPLYLGVLTDDEARQLLRQDQLPAAARPYFDDVMVETLRRECGNHPLLLQLAGRRSLELGDDTAALRQVAADRTLDHLFAVDLELLAEEERRALRAVVGRDGGQSPLAATDPSLRRLLALGVLRADGGPGVTIANRFLAEWLAERAASPSSPRA